VKARRCALAAAAAAVLLGACAAPPLPPPPAPVALPPAYVEGGAAHPAPPPRADWWRAFGDPTLDAIEQEVASDNPTLAQAAARLRRARAAVDAAAASGQPQLAVSAGVDRAHTSADVVGRSLAGRTVDDHAMGLGASWEPDLFGRVAAGTAAARADAGAAAADVAATRLALQAEAARDLLTLRSLDAESAVLADALAQARVLRDDAQARVAAGTASELDAVPAAQAVEDGAAEIAGLAARRAALEHALAALAGRPAAALAIVPAPVALHLPDVDAGLPAALLQRRPDIAAAQARVDAADARAGLARTAWFPDIVLSIGGGVESTALASLLTLPSRTWALGAGLAAPLLDGGRRRADAQAADADVDAAAAAYRAQVIAAIGEVEDRLADANALREEATRRARAEALAGRAIEIAAARADAGTARPADLAAARSAGLVAARAALLVERERLVASVGLVQALGGGWDAAAP